MAKNVFMEKKLFTGNVNLELTKRIMKCLVSVVWSVALYAADVDTDSDRKR